MSTQFIDTQTGTLEVAIDGHGAPAVLMHSLFVDSRSWDRVRGRLAEERRLVIITAPGHGASGDPGRRYSMGEVVDSAVSVLDRLGIAEPVDWVGNALGGHAGMLFASSRPDRCRSLVVLGAPVNGPSAHQRLAEWAVAPARAVFGIGGWVGRSITSVLLSPGTRARDPEAVRYVMGCLVDSNPRFLANAIGSLARTRKDMSAVLPSILAPTLFATGEFHSEWTPAQAEAAAMLTPRGTSTSLSGTAYLLPLEAPAETAALITDHWRKALS